MSKTFPCSQLFEKFSFIEISCLFLRLFFIDFHAKLNFISTKNRNFRQLTKGSVSYSNIICSRIKIIAFKLESLSVDVRLQGGWKWKQNEKNVLWSYWAVGGNFKMKTLRNFACENIFIKFSTSLDFDVEKLFSTCCFVDFLSVLKQRTKEIRFMKLKASEVFQNFLFFFQLSWEYYRKNSKEIEYRKTYWMFNETRKKLNQNLMQNFSQNIDEKSFKASWIDDEENSWRKLKKVRMFNFSSAISSVNLFIALK